MWKSKLEGLSLGTWEKWAKPKSRLKTIFFFFNFFIIRKRINANAMQNCSHLVYVLASFNHIWNFTRFSFLVYGNQVSANTFIFFDCIVVHLGCSFTLRLGRRRKETLLASEGKCKNPDVNYQYFILNISEVLQCRHKLIRWMASSLPSLFRPTAYHSSTLCWVSKKKAPTCFHLAPPAAPVGRYYLTHCPADAASLCPTHGSGSWTTFDADEQKKKYQKYQIKRKEIKAQFENSAWMGLEGSDPAGSGDEVLSLRIYYPEGCWNKA